MTPEEMEAKIAEQSERIASLTETAAKVAELEAKLTPPAAPDPDEAYKPKTWKELQERGEKTAEDAAVRVLEAAEKRKDELRKQEEETTRKQNEEVDKALAKLQEEGVIEETKDRSDQGGRQRQQILGMAIRMGGTDVDAAARLLKTAWEQGLEYDYESNQYVRAGAGAAPSFRMAPVGSSAGRAPAAAKGGPIDLRAVRGDMDRAQELWEAANR